MIFLLVFWLYLLSAVAISWQAGDRGDRRIMIAVIVAAAVSGVIHLALPSRVAPFAVLLVDIALLAVVVRFAFSSRRHWPIWFAGLHAAAMVAAASAGLFHGGAHATLSLIGGFWAMAALTAMAAGLLFDQKANVDSARL